MEELNRKEQSGKSSLSKSDREAFEKFSNLPYQKLKNDPIQSEQFAHLLDNLDLKRKQSKTSDKSKRSFETRKTNESYEETKQKKTREEVLASYHAKYCKEEKSNNDSFIQSNWFSSDKSISEDAPWY